MLTISQAQVDTFNTIARQRFLDEVTLLLHEALIALGDNSYSDPAGPTRSEREEVEALAQKAESFGLGKHESIGVFIQAAFFIGNDFYDVFRPVSEVLQSTYLDEDTKRMWLSEWYRSLLSNSKK